MKFKNLALTLGVTFGLAGFAAANDKCPVSGKAVDGSTVSTYAKVVGFCCGNCKGKFDKDPDAHVEKVAAAPTTHVNTACPVSGKDVDDSKTETHDGKVVAFCCGNCQKKFAADPDKFADKVTADNPANDKCPISGKSVDPDAVSVYSKEVAFCCGKCQKKFAEDPDALITKVK